MPKHKKGGSGGSGGLWNQAQNLANQTVQGAQEWNQEAHDISSGAQNYGQNNPFTNSAAGYNEAILGGDISRNPFMQTIHGATSGLNPSQDIDWLRNYAGPGGAGGAGGGSGSRNNPRGARGSYGRSTSRNGGNAGGGVVPDTVGNLDTFFARQMRDLFDPSHLDPANDPTLQPTIDMMQREAKEDYLGNLNALSAQAQSGGRFGSGLYQAMRGQQIDEQTEGVSQAIAQQLMGAYQAQMGRRQEGLGQVNARDIAAMQDQTNRFGIREQANAARSAAGQAAADAAEGRRLQAMGMSLDAQLGLLGLAGNMGSTLQQGQSDALNAGIGYGQLGMSGYNTGINAGQLGLSSLNMIGGVAQGMANAANQRDQMAYQREQARYSNQQDALNDYLNILMGVGGMGGSSMDTNPGAGVVPNYVSPWAAGVSGGLGAGLQTYGTLNR